MSPLIGDHPSILAVRRSCIALCGDGTPQLSVPPPPCDGVEFVIRRICLNAVSPALAAGLAGIPAGWFGLVEIAAHALAARGLARGLRLAAFSASDSGALTLWPDPQPKASESLVEATEAICEWAEARACNICMADGTPDAELVDAGPATYKPTCLRLKLGRRARTLPAETREHLVWPRLRYGDRIS